jgi:hypothetical protein
LTLALDMLTVDTSTRPNFPGPHISFLKGIVSMRTGETVSIRARQQLKWGVDLPPVRGAGEKPVTSLNAWMYVVPKGTKHKELAE